MSRYIFDIETDDLLSTCTRCWIVYLQNIDTGEEHYFLEGDLGWQDMMTNAKLLAGHNVIGFDFLALEKLFGWIPSHTTNVHDTLIMSQVLDYKRFGNDGHSLDRWGEYLGYPKITFKDFHKYSDEMLRYCKRDVNLNFKVYKHLIKEVKEQNAAVKADKKKLGTELQDYLRAEHAAALWSARAEYEGWPLDVEKATKLYAELESKVEEAERLLNEKLGTKTVPKDMVKGVTDVKKIRITKAGCYDHHTAKWFDIAPESWQEEDSRLVVGDYCRVETLPLKLSSVHDVKIFLFRNGWVPTEYNLKRNPVTGEIEKTSPKITEDSLEFLGGDGKIYLKYLTIKSRFSIVKTWLENVDDNGKLHGECFAIGTPSMRSRHKIIVNVPSSDSLYGAEMRELFIADRGWKMVGCDSAGNQARGLAHYLGNDEFTDILLNGDIHNYNAEKLTKVLKEMGMNYEVPRSTAKRILYAFLFGASGAKLWSYIFGTQNPKKGNVLKKGFTAAVPGFKNLLETLDRIYSHTKKFGEGYIPSIAGTKIYVDSYHKLLVYLLQSMEKATCSGACMLLMKYLEEENIPYKPCIYYHDELDFQVPSEFAERAKELGIKAFQEGPKLFNVQIMDGDGKVGNNWLEVH